jgi:transcriptional regulator GlxA family with amidase domain
VGYLSDSPLRQARYLFVSAITIYTRAAMDGGVPEEIAYNISDSYIQAADQLTDPDEITLLSVHAMREFTQEVADCNYRSCSPAVRTCCAYIQAHLHDPITLQDLADACRRSRNYVSDLFEKELHQRPMQYIRTQKLQAACNLLETTDLPVADIATTLAFPSHSSFSRYFAAHYGMTPLTYRRRKN